MQGKTGSKQDDAPHCHDDGGYQNHHQGEFENLSGKFKVTSVAGKKIHAERYYYSDKTDKQE